MSRVLKERSSIGLARYLGDLGDFGDFELTTDSLALSRAEPRKEPTMYRRLFFLLVLEKRTCLTPRPKIPEVEQRSDSATVRRDSVKAGFVQRSPFSD
jgi:hypothetical protein